MGVSIDGVQQDQYTCCVLWHREENGYHDSDWYATVWDKETKSVKEVLFMTTRAGMYGSAEIDCTLENKIKACRWLARVYYNGAIKGQEWNTLSIGRRVEVTKGRKVKKGTIATVSKILKNDYQSWNKRVLLKLEDGETIWTYRDNIRGLPYTKEERKQIYLNALIMAGNDQYLQLDIKKLVKNNSKGSENGKIQRI